MLLTRSPLGRPSCCHDMDLVRLACVRHAASVRPEPGSNSPLRSRTTTEVDALRSVCREPDWGWQPRSDWHKNQVLADLCCPCAYCVTYITAATSPEGSGAVARTSFVVSSVFKERPLRHAPLEEALVPALLGVGRSNWPRRAGCHLRGAALTCQFDRLGARTL